ncbi:MAG: Uma2 family endonuclease [Bryobacteraceae bacterium]|nr:Uma2 family endonuclease [Bryobacteraceae bacterium]
MTKPRPLREGDRLTSAEFLRRWGAMPELKHAELINGVVFFMPSPVSLSHSFAQHELNTWLWLYKYATPGCQTGSEGTWVMGQKDVPQPDGFLRILPRFGGQFGDAGDYGAGAPELIVEISGSSLSRDLGAKLDLYRRTGVREYLTVLLRPRQVIWRQLVRGRYVEIPADADGVPFAGFSRPLAGPERPVEFQEIDSHGGGRTLQKAGGMVE